ncbi:hypothetical protein LguiA_013160 [Lonicera macranthoides]
MPVHIDSCVCLESLVQLRGGVELKCWEKWKKVQKKCLSFSPRSSRPKATDPEGSEAFVHVSSEWEVVQGLGSPSKSFGDNPQDIFPGITLRIVNEENASYKPHRHSRRNYTRRYPSRVMTTSSPTTSRETHHLGK